jgi:predicted outer membrane repeat protein
MPAAQVDFFWEIAVSRYVSSLRRRLMVRALEDRIAPAMFVVNTFGAFGTGSGNAGDILYCVNQANAAPGQDTITFTYTGKVLVQQNIVITGPTIIHGPGTSIVNIDATHLSRIFDIETSAAITIDNLTLINGSAFDGGGAIRMDTANGNLTLSNCVIADNTGGVGSSGGAVSVAKNGTLTVDQCTISGNVGLRGAGFYFYYGGSLSLTNSTMSGNMQNGSTKGGGAIYFYGTVGAGGFTIRNTTITGNTASGRGGGISLNNTSGTFTITNSTITGNTAFTQGGGGIAVYDPAAVVNLESTIVAQNTGANAPDFLSKGTINAVSSFIGVTDGMAAFNPTACITGNLAVPADPKLGALANNGGPTLTQLPLPGSPVRNLGTNPAALPTDQRGQPRTVETFTDIGAVESPGSIPTAVLLAIPPITSPGPAPNTVRVKYSDGVAIDASTIGLGDIQILDPVGKQLLITGFSVDDSSNGTPRIATYTFMPPGGTWDAADSGFYKVNVLALQVFNTTGPNSVLPGTVGSFVVSMSNTYVVDATNDEAIDTDGKMSLREAIERADAPGSPDTITFDPTVFAGAQTISLALGDFQLTDGVTITGPAAKLTIDAKAKSRHFTIDANGAGSKFDISNLTLINGKVSGVTPADRGGSIRIADESVTITNCNLTNNTAEATGGAIYTDSTATILAIHDSNISNNASTGSPGLNVGSGGGVSIGQKSVTNIDRTSLSGNFASGSGGGLYFYYGGQATVTNSTISGNTVNGAKGGGGVYFYGVYSDVGLKITNSTISGNTAVNGSGGGLATFFDGGLIEISNSTVVNNISKAGGGLTRNGGFGSPDTFKLSSTIVAGNKLNDANSTPFDISLPSAGNIAGNNNLVGVANQANFTLTGTGNLTGTSAVPLDAKLGPLANNGGPTQTHMLLPGSPALNAGNNALGLTFDQRGAPNIRVDGLAADIGAYETQGSPAKVTSVVVNDGDMQRSRVLSVTVTLSRFISFNGPPENAFQLVRVSDMAPVILSAMVDNSGSSTAVRLTFLGPLVENQSLKDGRYTLTMFASQVAGTGLDGNGNGSAQGSPTDDFVYAEPAAPAPLDTTRIFRLFGDTNGNGSVDTADFGVFSVTFQASFVALDLNDNGVIDVFDFIRFRSNFGASI